MKSKVTKADEQLAEALSHFYGDPLGYVMFIFPWETEKSIQIVKLEEPYRSRFNCEWGPDVWACEFLDELGEDILERGFDGHTAVEPIRYATVSGHGIGKSTLVAWIIKYLADVHPLSKGIVTATTVDQLRTKTWAELGKWHNLSLTKHWFNYSIGRGSMSLVYALDPKYAGQWRCDAQTSKEENSESFAGLHAANSVPYYIFDEASGVPNKIYEVREGGATDGMPMRFDFGNGTQNSGYFYDNCEGKFRHRYKVRSIDSRDVTITNKALFKEWVEDYGEDSDFVRVRVRGMFPKAGAIQFIPRDIIEAAGTRDIPPQSVAKHDALVIGVDVARFGDDDTIIWPRIGMDARSWPIRRYKGFDTVWTVGQIIECIREFREMGVECSGLFIDGGNAGGGVIDQLNALGYNPIEVTFGGTAPDPVVYRYVMDYIWGKMRDALKTRLAIPNTNEKWGSEIHDQLRDRQYGYTLKGQIALESKKDMKARGGISPDFPDALACTFYQEVEPRILVQDNQKPQETTWDYDPFEPKYMNA